MEMVDGGGILTLRDAEPYELEQPTTISGAYDGPDEEAADPGTGAITAGTFSTPQVSVTQEITDPLTATVYIDATFSPVTPENLVGTVDVEGNVFLRTALKVDIHFDVGRNPTIIRTDCVSSPVELSLSSSAPIDPETGLVTLVDEDFTIPPLDESGCESNVRGAANEQLAGPGHAISLTVQTGIAPPQDPGEPVDLDFSVSPQGGSQHGAPVTLAATATPAAGSASADVPTGDVEFLAGSRVVGSAVLDGTGTAQVVTTDLPPGAHVLRARYRGDETYGPRLSAPVDHTVYANPGLSWDLPSHVQVAGAPADFSLTAINTGWGEVLRNARVDITITRAQGNGDIRPGGAGDRIALARVDGATTTPVPLTTVTVLSKHYLKGSIGAGTGVPLDPGQSLTEQLRLTLPDLGSSTVLPGPLLITIDVVAVDPITGVVRATVASSSGQVTMIEATRRATTVTAGQAALLGPGGIVLIAAIPPVAPHTVRAGNPISLNRFSITGTFGQISPAGMLSFLLDGKPIGVLRQNEAPSVGYRTEVATLGTGNFVIPVPDDAAPGPHTLTVRYGGNDLFLPSQASWTFQVEPNVGRVYECESPGVAVHYVGRGNVIAQAGLPSTVAAGTEVSLVNPVLRLLLDRGPSSEAVANSKWNSVVNSPTGFEVTYGGGLQGTSSATGTTRANGTRMDVAGDPDHVLTPQGLALSVVVEGAPGAIVPITLESFRFAYDGIGERISCTAVDDPVVLGRVTVAGTTLSVSPEGRVRAGSPVTLTASTAPVVGGFVEFLDGSTTVGVAEVDASGAASLVTTALPEGELSLTARYHGGLSVPTTTSVPVALTVVGAACPAFAEEGHAAVVRLVYLELLGRCPDQAGFDYWVGRLEAGLSPEVFARTIAATPEAVGRVVDDAYETMLGRRADAPGRAFWVGRLRASGRYDQLLADLGASGEFWTLAGATNEGFVVRVYERLLGRSPDQAGQDYWVGRLAAGTSRRTLIRALANLDEPLGRLVGSSYEEILGRTPTPGERGDGITFLRSTGDRSELYAELIGRPEFATRAQDFPNTDD